MSETWRRTFAVSYVLLAFLLGCDGSDLDMLGRLGAFWSLPADEEWTGSPAPLGCAGSEATIFARPETPRPDYEFVRAFAQDDTNIYVALRDPHIWALAKSGGQAKLLWVGEDFQEAPTFMVLDDTHLYFTTSFTLRRVARTGGPAETLVEGLLGPRQLALDHSFAYWADAGALNEWRGRVGKVPKAGGAVTILADGTNAVGVSVSNGEVYYLVAGGAGAGGGIFKTSAAGGPATLVHAGGGGSQLLATPGHLFALMGNSVVRVDRRTGASETFVGSSVGGQSLAVDDTHVYWTVEGYWAGLPILQESGRVFQAAQAGGEVTALGSCLPKPQGIVVDARHVYWVNAISSEILRLEK